MAAATAMQCEHWPNGSIQWLRVKPTSHHRIRMVIKIASNLPAFSVVIDSLFAHNVS
jgi:hypothetical protein